jgi:hypothetical protein
MIKKTKTKAKNAAKKKSRWQSGMVDLMQAVNISRLSSFFMTGASIGKFECEKDFYVISIQTLLKVVVQ